ncbi:MAG: hypothetical protein P1U30_05565 [Phycisphaerales bacterium]|nr:hypothetical protein [Phycisphaerales bacterium]
MDQNFLKILNNYLANEPGWVIVEMTSGLFGAVYEKLKEMSESS